MTATTAPPPTLALVPRLRRLTTPAILWLALGVLVAGAVLLLLVAEIGVGSMHASIKTVGRDSAPSIIAALELRASLVDMDANAANDLLGGPNGVPAALQAFESDRQTVSRRLVDAAQNITYGDAERTPILTVQQQLGTYLQLVAQAQSLHRQDPAAALTTYRQATDLMHNTILPAAAALEQTNWDHLQARYGQQRAETPRLLALIDVVGALLLAALVAAQIFLARRTRRVLNLPLVAATAVALVFLVWLTATLATEAQTLKDAKQDAFDSVHALWGARAVANDANADESLYLLDPQRAAGYESSFRAKSAQLADAPVNDQLLAAAGRGRVTFHGYLGDELRNITYPGERQAALDTLRAWGQYLQVDGQIRALERSGQHQAAIDLDTGTAQGQSDWAFAQFDSALGRTLDINQKQFDLGIDRGFAGLRSFAYLGPLAMLLVAALVWLGLRPRLNEYRA